MGHPVYLGVDKPGQIIYFDHKGEVMGTTSFNPGMAYGEFQLNSIQ